MDLKNYSTGVQHIGIPTNDIDKTMRIMQQSFVLEQLIMLHLMLRT